MIYAVYAVFLANIRSLRAQIFRSFHSRWGAYTAAGIGAVAAVAINIAFYSLFKNAVGLLLSATEHSSADNALSSINAQHLLQGMTLNFLLAGSLVTLLLCALLPVKSYIGLAAKVFGARRAVINTGETLSTFAVATVSIFGMQLAFFWCLAEQSPAAVLTMVTLFLASAIFIGATLLLKNLFQIFYERLLKINSELSTTLSILSTLMLLLAAFANTLDSSLKQSEPLFSYALQALWLGEALPRSPLTFLIGTAALTAVLTLLMLSYHFQADKSALYNYSRLLTRHAPARCPRKFRNFVFRELLISFRHPNSQATFIITLLLTLILATAVRTNLVFPALALYLCIFFCATGAELAYGRTIMTHWIYQGTNYSVAKVLAAKFCAVLIAQGGLFLLSLFVAFPPQEALKALPQAIPLLFGLLALSFFCGILIPYSDTAPLSMLGAYALLLLLDVGIFYGQGKLAEYHVAYASLFLMGIGTVALLSGGLLAEKEATVTGQGSDPTHHEPGKTQSEHFH